MLPKRVDYQVCPEKLPEFLNEDPVCSGFVYILFLEELGGLRRKSGSGYATCALRGEKGFLVKREDLSRFYSLTAGYRHRKTFQKRSKKRSRRPVEAGFRLHCGECGGLILKLADVAQMGG
jgi:hypothetical protein